MAESSGSIENSCPTAAELAAAFDPSVALKALGPRSHERGDSKMKTEFRSVDDLIKLDQYQRQLAASKCNGLLMGHYGMDFRDGRCR